MLKPIAVALLAAAAAFAAPAAHAQDSIRFAVTDIDGAESLQREFGPFKAAFEKVADVKVQFFAVSGRTRGSTRAAGSVKDGRHGGGCGPGRGQVGALLLCR